VLFLSAAGRSLASCGTGASEIDEQPAGEINMRNASRRTFGIRLAVLGMTAALLAGCVSTGQSGTANTPLAIHGNKTTFEIAPVLLASERSARGGAAGVKMGGVPNLFSVGSAGPYSEPGIADLATNAETQALRISTRNPDLRIIMTVSEGLYRIVGRKSAGIATLADLKGKRIATMPGTSSGYFVHKMLKTVGLTLDDVTIVPILPLTSMPKALEERQVDAVAIWEPEMENAAVAIGDDAIEFSGKGIYREVFNLNTTGAALADPVKRRRIVEYVAEVIRASADIRANPSVVWPLVEAAGGYSRPVIARAWPHHSFPAILVPDLLDVLVEEEIWLAGVEKRTPRTREELARLIDPTVLQEAMALASR
jgi:NitT/TauT family transport system substrate-binding protein